MIISKKSPNEFCYSYATFIDILQSGCPYIILQNFVWKWHFDYKLHASEYKSCRIGKEVPSLLARVFYDLTVYYTVYYDIWLSML